MNAPDLRTQLLAIRAQVDLALAAVDDTPAPPPAEPMVYCSLGEYAQHRAVSIATVKRWRRAGMPVTEMGRAVRVKVETADEWVGRLGKGKPER